MKNVLSGIALLLAAVPSAQADPDGTKALYELTFDATWSAETHPTAFPENAHFSPLGGGTHNGDVSFWDVGELASPGVKRVAEAGNYATLLQEVDVAIAEGTAASKIAFRGIFRSPRSIMDTFTSRSTYSRVTILSMLAPSPDWFVGVSGLELRDDDQWRDEIVVDLFPYDAGTKEGTNFSPNNPPTNPRELISLIDEFPFDGTPSLGTFTFRLLSITPPMIGDMNADDTIDFDDVAPFVLGLSDPAAYEATYGLAAAIYGDTDGNGQLDFDDIAGFVSLLDAPSSVAAVATSVPEPSGAALAASLSLVGLLIVGRRSRVRSAKRTR